MKRFVIITLLVLALIFGGLIYFVGVNEIDPIKKRTAFGIAKMLSGLILLWIVIGGALMYRYRDAVRAYVLKIPVHWQLKFVVFAILVACLEEAVTVSMTNLAPFFGSRIGEAYITASANYFDTIFFHSVIVFVPLFIALSILLKRYAFSVFGTFLIFGVVGTIGEAVFAGNIGVFMMFPVWAFVYGLMVFLPAYSLPEDRGARPVHFFHYVIAVPAVFLLALPLLLPIVYVISVVLQHPGIDFVG